jgi:glyceraldehyde 3-phosphate dehydrogenase
MQRYDMEVVAINDPMDIEVQAHLLKYDSVHGRANFDINIGEGFLTINNDKKVSVFDHRDPAMIPWGELGVDIVVECSGRFKSKEQLVNHLKPGVKRIILSVPPETDDIKTIVLGVNEQLISDEDLIVSNASCTTNNAAPMIKVMQSIAEIESAFITTIHSYTTDQGLHDAPHKDLRRARAAAQSIVPTTTGAAKALTKVFPDLSDSLGGCGIRVPVPDGSLTDITFSLSKPIVVEQVNEAFRIAAENGLKGILEYTEDPIVSRDVIGNPASCLFDSQLTSVVGKMVKVVGWYDNEIGYSNRLADLAAYLSR